MTLEEYNRLGNLLDAKEELQAHQDSLYMRKHADEIVAKNKRENLRKRTMALAAGQLKEEEEKRDEYTTYEEPGTAARPLGQWQVVVHKYERIRDSPKRELESQYAFLPFSFSFREEKHVDLQLPYTPDHEYKYVPAVTIVPEVPVKKFKEKTISSLDDSDSLAVPDSFKKRKFGNKRNARQRLDDDE